MKHVIITLFAVCAGFLASAQMVIENTLSPSQLVNDVLLGEGIEAENITMNGDDTDAISMQFGYFNASSSNIGIGNGIILATGGVSVAESPNDLPTAFVTIPEDEELTVEPDLEQIMSPAELNDAAVIEFDFTAKGDTLRFKYVFASEEYNEHTCSPYNDAFGFFISGPGIVGDGIYENDAKNLALVPGTNVPVAINTVNQGFAGEYGSNSVCNAISDNWEDNAVYFVNNEENTDISATQFDGFTVPFEVEIPVICGGTYHIKLAIGDAVDGKNDSAVFLEAGSFSSEAPMEAELTIINPNTQGYAQEGCSHLGLRLERSDSTQMKTIYVQTQGFTDVESIIPDLPDSIVFYPMDGVMNLEYEILDNSSFESLRNAQILLLQPEVCSLDTAITELAFPLFDVGNMTVDYDSEIVLDCDETGTVDLQISGGNPPYNIEWDGGYTGSNFEVDPETEITLTGTVTDLCGINQVQVEILVYRQTYEPVEVVVPAQVNFNCAEEIEVEPLVSGGIGNYGYIWELNGDLVSTQPVFNQVVDTEGQLSLTVTDQCMPSATAIIQTVSMTSPIVVNLGPDTSATCAETLTLVPEVYGGFGNLQFVWKLNQNPVSSSSTYSFVPSQTSGVILEVSDECGQVAQDDMLVYMTEPPIHLYLSEDTVICAGSHLFIEPSTAGGYGEFEYTWNGVPSDDGILSDFPEETTVYELEITDECGRKKTHEYLVEVQEVESRFEFRYHDQHKIIDNLSTLDCNFTWTFVDGSQSDQFEPLVDLEILRDGYTHLHVVDALGCEASSRQKFQPDFSIFIPNAFTPDGDGLNDLFKAHGEFIAEFEIFIFDRWGQLVYHSTDITEGWDGEAADESKHTAQDHIFNYRYVAKSWTGEIDEGKGVIHMLR